MEGHLGRFPRALAVKVSIYHSRKRLLPLIHHSKPVRSTNSGRGSPYPGPRTQPAEVFSGNKKGMEETATKGAKKGEAGYEGWEEITFGPTGKKGELRYTDEEGK